MRIAQILVFTFLISVLPHLDRFSVQAATESNPKEIFDTSKQQTRTKNTKMTSYDETKKTKKTCETLKNGKVFCTEKHSGRKSQILNSGSSRK